MDNDESLFIFLELGCSHDDSFDFMRLNIDMRCDFLLAA